MSRPDGNAAPVSWTVRAVGLIRDKISVQTVPLMTRIIAGAMLGNS